MTRVRLPDDFLSGAVDFATQERTPKDSAAFYAEVIAANGGASSA